MKQARVVWSGVLALASMGSAVPAAAYHVADSSSNQGSVSDGNRFFNSSELPVGN
jgi:hypothetical protein